MTRHLGGAGSHVQEVHRPTKDGCGLVHAARVDADEAF